MSIVGDFLKFQDELSGILQVLKPFIYTSDNEEWWKNGNKEFDSFYVEDTPLNRRKYSPISAINAKDDMFLPAIAFPRGFKLYYSKELKAYRDKRNIIYMPLSLENYQLGVNRGFWK